MASLAGCPDEADVSTTAIRQGKEALARGDCATARSAFRGGTTSEAQFGEALARTMCLVEHPFVASVLDDLRYAAFRSEDFFGPDGIIALARRDAEDDATGLHPLLDDPDRLSASIASLADSVTIEAWLDRAEAFADELGEISLLFEAAGTGSGIVFDVPASMIGNGRDIRVAASDAVLIAAGFAAADAAIRLAASFRADIRINRFCDGDDCALSDRAARDLTDELNRGLGASSGDLSPARAQLANAMALLQRGLLEASSRSVVVSTRDTDAILDYAFDLAAAAERSLASGSESLPGVDPTIRGDIRELFASPPDLGGASMDPFVGELEWVEGWFEEIVAPYVDLDFDDNYEVRRSDELEDAFDSLVNHLEDVVENAGPGGGSGECDDDTDCGGERVCQAGRCMPEPGEELGTRERIVGAWAGEGQCQDFPYLNIVFICPGGRYRGATTFGNVSFVNCGTWSMETGSLFRTDYTSTDTVLGESERQSKEYLYDASTDTLSEGCPIVLRRAIGEISEEDCESSVCSEWGSGSVECRTDCDCGRCWYCEEIGGENGVCRYGGEGPAGCFRGCSG
jgi:hypothetical protein